MSKTTLTFIAINILLLAGIGFAQGGDQNVDAEEASAENAEPLNEALSEEDQLTEAQAVTEYGRSLSGRVSNMLNEARKESDIIRITCLNDKLTQINANLRNAQQRLEALTKTGDKETRSHEYTVLMVLKQKFKTLDQEAGQCVGQDIFEVGNTQVTTEIDESAAGEDESPTTLPADFGAIFVEATFPDNATTPD